MAKKLCYLNPLKYSIDCWRHRRREYFLDRALRIRYVLYFIILNEFVLKKLDEFLIIGIFTIPQPEWRGMMKTTVASAALAVIFLLSVSGLRAANFSGSDDFSDNSIDLNKWSNAYGGFGEFTEITQRLELDIDGGDTDGDSSGHLPWKSNYGSYTLDWEVYYDVDVPAFSMFSGEESSGMGIGIYKFPVMQAASHIMLEQGTDGYQYIAGIETISSEDEVKLATISTTCSLRIHWDASATMLYFDYDSDGGADNWTNLASWNIGTGQPYSWDMTDADSFMCVLTGSAETNHTGESNPSGDNFVADGAFPEAPLALFRPGTGLWALRNVTRAYFGGVGDTPVYSDYDGDGTKDIAIFRGASGLWAIRGITRAYFGGSSDEPIPGDYNDDGFSDIAIFRESAGLWAVRGLTRSYFGTNGDIPLDP